MAESPMPPSGALDTSKSYRAHFKTERGEIVAELYADKVPVKLAKPGRSGSRRAVQVTGGLR